MFKKVEHDDLAQETLTLSAKKRIYIYPKVTQNYFGRAFKKKMIRLSHLRHKK